jgi:hypothetical protein
MERWLMRSKIHLEIKVKYIVILTILLILLFSNIVVAQEQQLFIEVNDEVYENEDFLVSAYTLDENDMPIFQIGVEIEFNGMPYNITDESAVVSIKAPQVSKDTSYIIKASKSGYASFQTTITVKKQLSLIITLDGSKYTVKTNEKFSVVVKDENDNPIAGATVGIQGGIGDVEPTNVDGRAWLTAPSDRTEITIKAQKEGYQYATTTVKIDASPGLIEILMQSQYTPIALAVIAVIVAIVLVNLRQRKQIDVRTKEISKAQTLKQSSSQGAVVSMQPSVKIENQPANQYKQTENIDRESKRGPKVEEIRISRSRKEKEIVHINAEEEKVDETIPRKVRRRHEYDWFEGTDDIRYEIDKITGKIDEEGADKWFEGIDDIRAKIDEKVKKKDKKKDNQT